MQTMAQLGEEYLDTAEVLRIQMKKLQLDLNLLAKEALHGSHLEKRIDCLYREILQMTDIGNQLITYDKKKGESNEQSNNFK